MHPFGDAPACSRFIDRIAVIWPPLKKKLVESTIEQTTTASGALNPDCREAFPYALDVSFETLKNPRFQARGFFSSRGLWHKPGTIHPETRRLVTPAHY